MSDHWKELNFEMACRITNLQKISTMRIFIMFFLLVNFSFNISAQNVNSEVEPKSATFLSKFEKRELKRAQLLHLTPEQFKNLDDINDSYVTRYAAIAENKNIPKKEKKQTIKQFQNERYDKFVNLLQPDQKVIWNSLKVKKQRKFFRKK